MNEIKKPIAIVLIAPAIVAAFSLMALALAGGNNGISIVLKLTIIFPCSFVIILSLSQSIIYLKQYVDYRFQELEKINQKRGSESSPNENVSCK